MLLLGKKRSLPVLFAPYYGLVLANFQTVFCTKINVFIFLDNPVHRHYTIKSKRIHFYGPTRDQGRSNG